MTTDVYYGAETALRVGIMADAATDPTAWFGLEYMSIRIAPQKERRDRAKLGAARHNPLDPIKPRPGFRRVSVDLVVDGDTRQVPRWLRLLLGAPTTTGLGPTYTHTWSSGDKTQRYIAIELRTGASEYRVIRGVTLAQMALEGTGENTQDFDLSFSLRGLDYARVSAALTGATTAAPAEAPILRQQYLVDSVAAANTLQAAWNWDRGLIEDAFLSTTPTLSGLRPGAASYTGTARFRANAATFDALSDNDTVFASEVRWLGVQANHRLSFIHPQAMLEAPPLEVRGLGIIERSVQWMGHQTGAAPAGQIVAVNDVTSYAT